MKHYHSSYTIRPVGKRRSRNRRFLYVLLLVGALLYFWDFPSLPWMMEPVPVTELHPLVAQRTDQLVEEAQAKGIQVLITSGFRSEDEQDVIYAQGRSLEGSIVTHAKGGESYHNYGLAVDFALLDSGGAAIWDMTYDGNNNGSSDWMEVVELAKRLEFSWGGDWERFPDYPHLQMDFGLSIRELMRGKRPPMPEEAEGES